MRRRYLFLTLVLILVNSISLPAEREDMNTDWIFLEKEWVDVFLCGFHEKFSGAFISVHISPAAMLKPAAPQIAKDMHLPMIKGENHGWPYSMVLAKEDREIYLNQFCPPGQIDRPASVLIVTFTPVDSPLNTWNFTSVICNPSQLDHVRKFLLNGIEWKAQIRDAAFAQVTSEKLKTIQIGQSWQLINKSLGAPMSSTAFHGGFIVGYDVAADEKETKFDKRLWFEFDQERTLRRMSYVDPHLPLYPGPSQ